MILNALPPKDAAADARFETMMQEMDGKHEIRRKKRTLPAEWAPQSAIQLTWPHAATDWAPMLSRVTECYLKMAFEMASRQPLLIVTPEPENLRLLLKQRLPGNVLENIGIAKAKTDDTWARDHGFITVEDTDGWHLLDFRNRRQAESHRVYLDGRGANRWCSERRAKPQLELCRVATEKDKVKEEGETNQRYEGDALPQVDKGAVEHILQERLGAQHILWLHHGYLAGDDTDSHIDTLARLCPDDTILYVKCDDRSDEHYIELQAMEKELEALRTATGKPFRLIPLPMAAPCVENGERLPATYANFLIMNTAVLVPTYAQESDAVALRRVAEAFPGRDVVGIDCRPLIVQHGSLHCCTMQYPRGVYNETAGRALNAGSPSPCCPSHT